MIAGDNFMPKMHLRQPRFSYSACEPFTKNIERIQTFKETGDSRFVLIMEILKIYLEKKLLRKY